MELLLACRDEVVQAAVLGLDAEWEPGSRKPQATLVQLAAWSGEDSLRVYLLVSILSTQAGGEEGEGGHEPQAWACAVHRFSPPAPRLCRTPSRWRSSA